MTEEEVTNRYPEWFSLSGGHGDPDYNIQIEVTENMEGIKGYHGYKVWLKTLWRYWNDGRTVYKTP